MIADGERAERLKINGCRINQKIYRPEVWNAQEAHGVDLLIVSLKYTALPGALETIQEAVGRDTIVMSLMNGVDSEERIGEKIGASHVLPALIKVASPQNGGGVSVRSGDDHRYCVRRAGGTV